MLRASLRLAAAALCLLGAALTACRETHPRRTVTRAFYFWKTAWGISDYEQGVLDSLEVRTVYLRIADVDVTPGGDFMPVGSLRFSGPVDTARYRFVPVVFVTTDALAALRDRSVPLLAQRIVRLVSSKCSAMGITPREIQLDCDWTGRSKDIYFSLLEAIRHEDYCRGKVLSCTIRLHQIKDAVRNGIPPVDRGMAMVYNLGNLRQPGDHNSIFSRKEAGQYLAQVGSYPLPLDVALPIFSWSVHFRDGLFRGILRDVSPEEVRNTPAVFGKHSGSLFTCTADTSWHGFQLRKGDVLRLEEPDPGEVESVAHYLSERLPDTACTVAVFHLDEVLLKKHPHHELAPVYEAFR